MKTWILVADEARARLFETGAHDSELKEIEDIAHPEGRMRGIEFTRDKLPSNQESVGGARHAIAPHTDIHDKQAQEFARTLAQLLEQGRVNHAYTKLILVAGPRFLGQLKAALDGEVSKLVSKTFSKGMTQATLADIHHTINERP